MIKAKDYIGTNSRGDTHIFQDIGENGLIRGFNGYCVVETVQSERGLENVQWTHKETVNGVTYESGNKPAPIVPMPEDIEGLYELHTFSCSECGACHDSEGDVYGRTTYVILNECDVYCKECVKADSVLTLINEPSDLFKAKDVSDTSNLDTDYEEITTLFCDSSGFGNPGERALTKNEAIKSVKDILSDNKDEKVYAGITGIGQFQVYVTLYRKVS